MGGHVTSDGTLQTYLFRFGPLCLVGMAKLQSIPSLAQP